MTRHRLLSLLATCLITTSTLAAAPAKAKAAAPEAPAGLTADAVAGLELRGIGPALTSGRIGDIAVDPTDPKRRVVAVASGGVWVTANAGTTWKPVFDGQGSYSIGCVTLDPKNPNVIWVGSGENNSQRSVGYGDGVYRSRDGGTTWENLGLKASEHIGMIAIDPRDSNVVYVAAQGPLWAPGGDRGLYKSTDGGASWKAVLTISENTGVSEVHLDPRDPDTLLAVAYQRRRHVWTLIDGGPESAIHKSTDGGATWRKVAKGLPEVDLGRIGLDISPAKPDVVYAVVEAADGKSGFYRSTDRGETWQKRSDYVSSSPQYYQELVADPHDPDRVYSLDTYMQVSEDGGKTFSVVGNRARHVDDHALWIDPADTAHLLVGGDGGLYESFDRGATWRFQENLPVTQFYRVAVDDAKPFYNVYGGTQDNMTLGGPSRTLTIHGIANQDWYAVVGGDGFWAAIDPEDPNIVYAESQHAGVVRFDRRTGEKVGIRPQERPGEDPLRFNWDSPLLISPHSHTRLYLAAQRLFRSDDRGDTWKPVSGDLTRRVDRNALPVMGKVWGPDAVAKNALDVVLRQHRRPRRVAARRGSAVRRHRRRARAGQRGRRRRLAQARHVPRRAGPQPTCPTCAHRSTTPASSTPPSTTTRWATSSRTCSGAPTAAAPGPRSPATCRCAAACTRSPRTTSTRGCCSPAPSSAPSSPPTAAPTGCSSRAACR